MLFLIGIVVVLGCVAGGYVMHHGKLALLWQPNELVIIMGAALGSFLLSNHMKLVKKVGKSLGKLVKGSPYKKSHFLELLVMLYTIFKLLKTKGMLEIESHIENPHESAIFSQYPAFMKNHHALHFLCDYLRVMTMGVEDFYQLEELMDRDIEVHHTETEHVAGAISSVADAMPALGIVAAVLGVITTMQSITEPPEILGGLIGAALVGTFLGVLVAYGFIAPMAKNLGAYFEDEGKYIQVIKVALLAHVKGNAPLVSVEFARSAIGSVEKPTFQELEEAVNAVPSPGA